MVDKLTQANKEIGLLRRKLQFAQTPKPLEAATHATALNKANPRELARAILAITHEHVLSFAWVRVDPNDHQSPWCYVITYRPGLKARHCVAIRSDRPNYCQEWGTKVAKLVDKMPDQLCEAVLKALPLVRDAQWMEDLCF